MMENKKYEFIDGDTIIASNGKTLRRIRALVAIGLTVDAGDLGGYIESKNNLSASGNARVSGDALVEKRNDVFLVSSVGSENGTLTVTNGKSGLIVTRGCFCGSVEEFLSASEKKHDEKIRREYQLLIEVAKSRILGATQ